MEASFSFYGVSVRISTQDAKYESVLHLLGQDFSFFSTEENDGSFLITLEVKAFMPIASSQRGKFFFKNKAASVYGWKSERVVDYGNSAWVKSSQEAQDRPRRFELFCSSIEDAHEIAYLTLLSAVGEELDKKGYHRVHALGLRTESCAGIVVLPSGGGKSSMAMLLKDRAEFKLFSDETPLIHGNQIYPFPVRMALRREVAESLGFNLDSRTFKRRRYVEKLLYAIPPEKIAAREPLSIIVVGGILNRENASTRRCSKVRVFASLMNSMVVGIGVAQIAEQMIRVDTLPALVKIAFSRLFEAIYMTVRSKCYLFDLSRDERENTEQLVKLFNDQSES